MPELPGRKDIVSPFLKIRQQDIVSWRNYSAFVDTTNQFNNDFLASVVIDYLELSDVVVLLHDSQKFQQDFGNGLEKDLLFAFAFGIDDSFEGVCKDIDLHHRINY